jgi:hypothetical protein
MPYINSEKQSAIKANVNTVADPGDLNFLITLNLIRSFKDHPRYEMIHILKRDFVTYPKDNTFLQHLRDRYAHLFTVSDIYAAASNAFDEFYRRVAVKYEEKKIRENGDLPEYVEVLALIDAPKPVEVVEAVNVVDATVVDSTVVEVVSDTPEIEVTSNESAKA